MSKGSGAKVYFVLYLAVVLELLIIIVERDEAEEHLHAKQKETMKIVESILSQLQAGAGSEGMNTRPQDEITLTDNAAQAKEQLGIELKSNRKYIIEVGITNVASELKRKENEEQKEFVERVEKLVELANVAELEYAILESSESDPNNAPVFPSDSMINARGGIRSLKIGESISAADGKPWTLKGYSVLEMEEEATKEKETKNLANIGLSTLEPIYKPNKFEGEEFRPNGAKDFPANEPTFYYSPDETMKANQAKGIKGVEKRAFVVNFQPRKGSPGKVAWYKLYFASKTNRILGVKKVKGQEIDIENEETKINIGTVTLKAKDLKKVMVELEKKLSTYLKDATYEVLKEKQDLLAFDNQLYAAQKEASAKGGAEGLELKNNIKLYGYIAKLLVPGLSASFGQNKGSIQYNIKVQSPNPQVAKPSAFAEDEYVAFDELAPTIRFSISPYLPDKKPTVEIADESGKVIETISDIKVKGTPQKNEKAQYVALAGRNFQGNQQYKVIIRYSTAAGQVATEEKPLTVFKALENEREDINKLEPTYGVPFNFVLKHRSTAKVNQSQFRYYVSTDNQPSNQYLPEVKNLPISETSKKLNARVTWFDAERNREVELFTKDYNIKLGKASLGGLNQSNVKQTESTSGIGLNFSTTARVQPLAPGKYPDVEVIVQYNKGKVTKGNLSNFKNKTYNLSPNAEGLVTINHKDFISGSPDSESNTLRGDFTIVLIVKAKHPTFDLRSDQSTASYVVKFNKNFDE
jgi:hypothetical protein